MQRPSWGPRPGQRYVEEPPLRLLSAPSLTPLSLSLSHSLPLPSHSLSPTVSPSFPCLLPSLSLPPHSPCRQQVKLPGGARWLTRVHAPVPCTLFPLAVPSGLWKGPSEGAGRPPWRFPPSRGQLSGRVCTVHACPLHSVIMYCACSTPGLGEAPPERAAGSPEIPASRGAPGGGRGTGYWHPALHGSKQVIRPRGRLVPSTPPALRGHSRARTEPRYGPQDGHPGRPCPAPVVELRKWRNSTVLLVQYCTVQSSM